MPVQGQVCSLLKPRPGCLDLGWGLGLWLAAQRRRTAAQAQTHTQTERHSAHHLDQVKYAIIVEGKDERS